MYIWKNSKIRKQYDLLAFTAKNDGLMKYTDEELHSTNLKAKAFQGIKDPSVRRLVELAYILGTLHGLEAADKELENSDMASESTTQRSSVQKESKMTQNAAPQIAEECLYVVVCKVKNRQDKIAYVTHCVKARGEEKAMSAASMECGMKNQTMMKGKIIKSYGSDSMQFQFGIGQKELDTLASQGKKYL